MNTSARSILFIVPLALASAAATASPSETRVEYTDSVHALGELNVVALKQEAMLRDDAVSATVVGSAELDALNTAAMKGISDVVPNFYIPDYGSRITSTMYVRGIGARMDQPAVGLNVDNVPYLNKNAYDFDLADIESVEMLRGPQSTLYGRNTIGGLVNITTLSPLRFQGWRVTLLGGKGNDWRASAGWYHKFSPSTATAVIGSVSYLGGFFRNKYNGRHLDHELSGALRWKFDWRLSPDVRLRNAASASMLRQGGYPYEYVKTGEINYNDTCFYRRFIFTDGLTLNWRHERFTMSSITSVQYLDDNMTLDQDFTTADLFTLTQKRREWGFTEDLFTRGSRGNYSWLGGVFGFYRPSTMHAPVDFKDQGIAQLIEHHRNEANPTYPISWYTRRFTLGSDFRLRNGGFALYHESKYTTGRWTVEAALRYDFEHAALHWHSACATGYNTLHVLPDGTTEHYSSTPLDIDESGDMSMNFSQLLPKVAVSYRLGAIGDLYVNVAKGYKAGGYNVQMFSDVLQQKLMRLMGFGMAYNPEDVVPYRPGTSWNYEAGAHLHGERWTADATVFFIDTRDRQLTTFPAGSTTGRIMTNAARAHSCGIEASATWTPDAAVTRRAAYGYTHATFRSYTSGGVSYRGKTLPYAPAHTLFASAEWTLPVKLPSASVSAGANVRAAGPIWWDDANTQRQPFYATLGAHITVAGADDRWSLRLWGENLTDTHYSTFYFVSVGRAFLQRARPWQAGVTIRYAFDTAY